MLLAFLEQHGRPALPGVSERGMPFARAREFIGLLESHEAPLLGLEVWRSTANGYSIDLPWIWASSAGRAHDYAGALSWLHRAEPGPKDLVAVQFG